MPPRFDPAALIQGDGTHVPRRRLDARSLASTTAGGPVPVLCLIVLTVLLFTFGTLSLAGILPPLPGARGVAAAKPVTVAVPSARTGAVESLDEARSASRLLHALVVFEPARATRREDDGSSTAKTVGDESGATTGDPGTSTGDEGGTGTGDGGTIGDDPGDTGDDTGGDLLGTGTLVEDTESTVSDTVTILPDEDPTVPDVGSVLPDTGSLEVPSLP